jgi:hypothetical protein
MRLYSAILLGGVALASCLPYVAQAADAVRYSGPHAYWVKHLLDGYPGWSCPRSTSSQAGAVPPKVTADTCMRDKGVAAAVQEAWAAECYTRVGRAASAQEQAEAMAKELSQVDRMCTPGALSLGGPSCDTIRVVPCPMGHAP